MYKNSDIFIASFHRIEKYLKSKVYNKKEIGFARAVKMLRKSNPIIRRYSDDLLEFAELRNAIVHNKTDITYAIAEPHDTVIERMKLIEEELFRPRTVAQLFSRKVYCFQQSENVSRILSFIRNKGFTKFPVYDGQRFKGLITQKGIAKWLAMNLEDNRLFSENTILLDILAYEQEGNYRFVAENTSVYEADDIFKANTEKGHRIGALLITKNGSPSEKLTGIITNYDIMKI
ncbi:hypothetical protein GCM10010978_24230 [Compostibacillus humi]|uniref:CBS domain-containing protein n=1 Tax=Compostibacillus humi TaxID=1245525 RepID=A0A8J2TTU4_9BACI|nr:CBS domain-containing protein [Compostibacillus humi]GFZ82702.1 hypothetical protein GCM10010978_24230 [Compostibacillus humi]